MKKTSLFLSVAWLAMAAMSFETHAMEVADPVEQHTVKEGAGAVPESPTTAAPAKTSMWKSVRQGLGKLTRSNSGPLPVTAPLLSKSEKEQALAKPAEAEDAHDQKQSIDILKSTDADKINAFKGLLQNVGKNRLGSAFSSSKKCRTWGGYRAELVAGRDFYGSNCAIEFCSHYCAPSDHEKFWAAGTLGETVCAFRCARGVSMGDSNARLKAAYDATKGRDVWVNAVAHWKKLEGDSVVNAENLVNADAADAVRSAKAIAAYKGTAKAAAKSTSPAIKQAETQYTKVVNAFIAAVVDLLTEVQKATVVLQKKIGALESTAKAVMATRTSVEYPLNKEQLESVFNTARDAAVKKVKNDTTKASVGGLSHDNVKNTLERLTQETSQQLTSILNQGQEEVAEVEGGSGEAATATASEEAITADLEAIIANTGKQNRSARSQQRGRLIAKYGKENLRPVLLALQQRLGDENSNRGARDAETDKNKALIAEIKTLLEHLGK